MRVSLHKRSQHRGIERRETEGENIRPQGNERSREESWIGIIERNARGRIVNQILALALQSEQSARSQSITIGSGLFNEGDGDEDDGGPEPR